MFPILFPLIFINVAAAHGEATVTLVDGSTGVGRIVAWTVAGLSIESADGTREIANDQVLDVRYANGDAGTAPTAPPVSLELVDGTRLALTQFTTVKRQASVETPYADEPVKISVDMIGRVHLQAPTEASDAAWRQLDERALAGDTLLVANREGAAIDYLTGVVGDVTAEDISFDWDGHHVPIKRNKVAALAYYHAQPRRLRDALCQLTLTDGSNIAVRTIKLDGDVLRLVTPTAIRLAVPLAAIARADYSAGKLIYLSDLKPENVKWTPLVSVPSAASLISGYGLPRNDQSYAGSPLSLAWANESLPTGREIRTYAKGVALRSQTELSYRVPNGMRRFKATVGVDPLAADQGHVVLEIRADDRVLWEAEVEGKRPPQDIDVALGPARRLHFRVDYGRNLDYGDRLHLIEARVTK